MNKALRDRVIGLYPSDSARLRAELAIEADERRARVRKWRGRIVFILGGLAGSFSALLVLRFG
jgi:hypothetical protein